MLRQFRLRQKNGFLIKKKTFMHTIDAHFAKVFPHFVLLIYLSYLDNHVMIFRLMLNCTFCFSFDWEGGKRQEKKIIFVFIVKEK